MSKPICTVMVGLPGLGKSTLVTVDELLYKKIDLPLFVYSTDRYIEYEAAIEGKTYDDCFETLIKDATSAMNSSLDFSIKNRQDIIWDQTNLGVGKRKKIINRMKQAGYQVRCNCIVPPEAGWISDQKVWRRRLLNREGKTIPQNILTNMIKSFTLPTAEEGFDSITFYNMYGALTGIDYEDTE